MSKVKAPSYPWYPADFLADVAVITMTLEEEGAYRRLLDSQWLNGFVPAEIWDIAAICKNVPVARMRKMWVRLGPLFPELVPGKLQNGRLERVREERAAFMQRQTDKGRQGANTRWHGDSRGIAGPMPGPIPETWPDDSSPSPSSSPSSKEASSSAREHFLAEVDVTAARFRPAFENAFRASHDPETLLRELQAMRQGMNAPEGRAVPLSVLGQALADIALNGEALTAKRLRVFCGSLLRGETPPKSKTPDVDAQIAAAKARYEAPSAA